MTIAYTPARRLLPFVAILIVLASLSSACGDGGNDEPAPTTTPSVTAAPTATATRSPIPTTGNSATGKIAFISSGEEQYDIYVMNADGSGLINLTTDSDYDFSPAWSPDGKRIAFSSSREEGRDIYLMNADGSGQTRLTNIPDALNEYPAWSPDGTRIAFISHDLHESSAIYVMNADGSGLTLLTDIVASPVYTGNIFAWSPDGTRIMFISRRDGNAEVYVINADGSGLTNLTNNPAYDEFPAWSPDGKRIAFSSERASNDREVYIDSEIYAMNADGSEQVAVTTDNYDDYSPTWSPDGKLIAFLSNRSDNGELYVMNEDGSGKTHLTDQIADHIDDNEIWWSPDSSSIAYVATNRRDDNSSIYVSSADSTITRLINDFGSISDLAWSRMP